MAKVVLIGLSLVAGGVIAAGIWAWTPDRLRSDLDRKYVRDATVYREVAGTTLRVRDTGPRDAPAILCLHGFGSSLETWEPWSQLLSADHRVVRLDLPGSGLSEPDRTGSYADSRSLQLIKVLMDQLDIGRAVLVGNSLGGRIAWRFAAAFPARVSKLVLISPDGFSSPGFDYGKPPKVPAVLNLIQYFLPRILVKQNLMAAYADPTRLKDADVDRYYDLLLAPGNRAAMLARMRQTVLEEPGPFLRRISAPTLLMWGEKDQLIPHSNAADYLHEIPDATLASLPTLGHVPQEESPDESITALKLFLGQ